jgi:thioredoxin reductase (NADPH)
MYTYEIVIIGGGMAGLSAALYGGWLGHTVLLADRQMFGGQIVNADQIENYPGFPDGVLGADLVSQVRMQALKLGAKMQYLEMTGIKIEGDGFQLATAEEPIQTKTVIVATGGNHRVLGIKGEAEFEGRGVSRCATCDGAFFRDQPVAVVGGGDTALDEALYLSKIASRVTIILEGATPIASETLYCAARERIRGSSLSQMRRLKKFPVTIRSNHYAWVTELMSRLPAYLSPLGSNLRRVF